MKLHGGTISIYSEPDQGTIVKIYFPTVEGQTSRIVTEPVGSASVLDKDLRGVENILLVEDNLQVRELTQAVLERLGYTVFLAETGGEALKVLEGHDGPVHLVLTDVIMPGMNGRELLATISETYPHIRTLLMSGYSESFIAHRGVLGESVNFVQKPFTVEALARKVRAALDS